MIFWEENKEILKKKRGRKKLGEEKDNTFKLW